LEGEELEDKEAHGRGDNHGDWNKQRDLEHGKFSYQLILDDGAQEALIMPTADDAKVLRGSSTTRTPSTGTPSTRFSSSERSTEAHLG
jgi:hypothetical protein